MTETVDDIRELCTGVLTCLRSVRADLSNEKRAQADLAEALAQAGLPVEREVRLAPGDVIDILVGPIGIEVKLKGARKRAVWKQLERYAGHEQIGGLILVSNLAMGLPPSVGGKPLWYVSLGKAWL